MLQFRSTADNRAQLPFEVGDREVAD